MGHLPRSLIVHCPPVRVATVEIGPTPVLPSENTVHLWYATLESLRPRLAELEALLDPVEQERAERFRFDVDRERFILGHGLLRSLLGKYLKRDASLVRMARGPFGKPYLERKDLRFNMSDTKDAVLIAFANTMKYIAITTSANFGNMVSMAVASIGLPFLPLAAPQILLNKIGRAHV